MTYQEGDKVQFKAEGKGARAYGYAGRIIHGTIDYICEDESDCEPMARVTWDAADKQRYPNPFSGSMVPLSHLRRN